MPQGDKAVLHSKMRIKINSLYETSVSLQGGFHLFGGALFISITPFGVFALYRRRLLERFFGTPLGGGFTLSSSLRIPFEDLNLKEALLSVTLVWFLFPAVVASVYILSLIHI